ncbi:MAG: hypothetical protein R3F54_15115 [Alphaproteobacteria bacterium]
MPNRIGSCGPDIKDTAATRLIARKGKFFGVGRIHGGRDRASINVVWRLHDRPQNQKVKKNWLEPAIKRVCTVSKER